MSEVLDTPRPYRLGQASPRAEIQPVVQADRKRAAPSYSASLRREGNRRSLRQRDPRDGPICPCRGGRMSTRRPPVRFLACETPQRPVPRYRQIAVHNRRLRGAFPIDGADQYPRATVLSEALTVPVRSSRTRSPRCEDRRLTATLARTHRRSCPLGQKENAETDRNDSGDGPLGSRPQLLCPFFADQSQLAIDCTLCHAQLLTDFMDCIPLHTAQRNGAQLIIAQHSE